MKLLGGHYESHPAADLFPLMTEEELDRLAADIREHDLQQPIVMHEGKVLDGRNRLLACVRADMHPRFVDWDGDGSPTAWVLSQNLHRRHLSPSQAAMVGAASLPMLEAEARERQGARTDLVENSPRSDAGRSVEKAAAAVGVSDFSIKQAQKVVEHGVPELAEAVRTGAVKVSAAAAVADEPAETQRALVKAGPKAVKAAAKAKRESKLPNLPKSKASPPPKSSPVYTISLSMPTSRAEEVTRALAEFGFVAKRGGSTGHDLEMQMHGKGQR